jgi:hypothetical protein
MPSHLSSIGLPINDQAGFDALADRIGPLATPINVGHGMYWRWSSACGAEMWLQTNTNNELVGMTPFFAGRARIRVQLTSRVARPDDTPLEGAFQGRVEPDDDDANSCAYPFVFDAIDYDRYASVILPTTVNAQIAAFAHEISVYSSLSAYNESQTGEWHLDSQSFIPSGMFSPGGESTDPPDSLAIFTGHVVATEIKRNSLSGAQYYWALVDTLGGSFDVVIDPELCDALPVVGGVISGSFWLCGRLTE